MGIFSGIRRLLTSSRPTSSTSVSRPTGSGGIQLIRPVYDPSGGSGYVPPPIDYDPSGGSGYVPPPSNTPSNNNSDTSNTDNMSNDSSTFHQEYIKPQDSDNDHNYDYNTTVSEAQQAMLDRNEEVRLRNVEVAEINAATAERNRIQKEESLARLQASYDKAEAERAANEAGNEAADWEKALEAAALKEAQENQNPIEQDIPSYVEDLDDSLTTNPPKEDISYLQADASTGVFDGLTDGAEDFATDVVTKLADKTGIDSFKTLVAENPRKAIGGVLAAVVLIYFFVFK